MTDKLGRYLERIGYQGTLTPDLETLRGLQLAHLRTVPFENLSIHRKQAIILDEALIYTKVVELGRGGFCYELNGLFAHVLRELGFEVSLLSAAVCGADGRFGPEFDHMALLVHLDADYLVDVGFGDSFQQPLRLDCPDAQEQGGKLYRIQREAEFFVLQASGLRDGELDFRPQYRFKTYPQQLTAFEAMCEYHQTSTLSHFTQKRICSIATADGRISLSDQRLIITTDTGRIETAMDSEAEFSDALNKYFGIVL